MHKRTIAVACSLLAALPIALLSAQEFGRESPGSGEYARIRHAVVSLKDYVQVPAMQAGVLDTLEMEDGTIIKEGVLITKDQLLGKLDDRDATARKRAAQLDFEVAQGEDEKAVYAIAAAEKTVEVAAVEVEETRNVNAAAPGAIPKTQVRRQVLTHQRSAIEAQVARQDKIGAAKTAELREAQVDVASLNLDHHKIRSPIDGEVVQVYRKVGEWVSPGDPLLRIVDLQTLRVEGFLKINDYLRQDIAGQPVVIEIQMPRGRTETFTSTISYVSPLVQASGDYRVVCEVKNRKANGFWVMLPGMDAELTIKLKQSQLASAP
ncbi:MAG: HlyD family efflux transporter periplasmic adaptor subunit [Pirellulaceae bacterium]|jgi:multidrug resistance efflux pump|nr:HlyD family efflux transporter periplasmic adaptor subunit [Pirellulaceae bacterium]